MQKHTERLYRLRKKNKDREKWRRPMSLRALARLSQDIYGDIHDALSDTRCRKAKAKLFLRKLVSDVSEEAFSP